MDDLIKTGDAATVVKLEIDPSVATSERNFQVISEGIGNIIVISAGAKLPRLKVTFSGSNNRLFIGRHTKVNAVVVFKGDKNSIEVGKHVGLVEAVLHAEYGTSITIGEGGIFSRGLIVRTGDSHSVIDIASGKRLNFAKSIKIDPWVWAGYDVSIMKGVHVKKNTIIGAGSIVNRSISESECMIAGAPAKVVRRGVVWDRRSLAEDPSAEFLESLLAAKGIDRADHVKEREKLSEIIFSKLRRLLPARL